MSKCLTSWWKRPLVTCSGGTFSFNMSLIPYSASMACAVSPSVCISAQADMVMIVQSPPQLNERKLLAEWYLTRENEGDARTGALKTLEDVTKTDYRALCVAVTSHEREVKKYCYFYGPVPDPFPHPEWKMGTPKQWRDEDEDNAKMEPDLFKRHAIESMQPETEAQFKMTAGMQVAKSYDITFKGSSLHEKQAPQRLTGLQWPKMP